jgi:carbon dioxide concentrating mechanism protein CcmL
VFLICGKVNHSPKADQSEIGANMRIALVIGSTVSTMKDESIRGRKLLIVRDADTEGKPKSEPYIAVDTVSAGTGDLVIVTDGSSARYTNQTTNAPVDAVIVGVIDSLELSGKVSYRKE